MEKIIKELVELASEGQKDMLIVRGKRDGLTLNFVSDKPVIDEEYIVGEINLEVYNTYEDIKEEIESMLE
ncbi:hypothetical protein [Paraclostridium bifermentans]|uniref:hypothetical protein n=1 Tax=Paraclostridium bifermentans TaxID=1490 RepID=UPI001C81D9CA|nr:hypothetical protein [Paraclostridium bifermentans]GIM32979.1 hypothetical protein PAGU1678_22490 [Paraclostridium bifermentans subsp. muricolitidis]